MTTPPVPGTVICFDLDAEDHAKDRDPAMEKGSISPGYDNNGSAKSHNSPTTVIDMRGVEGELERKNNKGSDTNWIMRSGN